MAMFLLQVGISCLFWMALRRVILNGLESVVTQRGWGIGQIFRISMSRGSKNSVT